MGYARMACTPELIARGLNLPMSVQVDGGYYDHERNALVLRLKSDDFKEAKNPLDKAPEVSPIVTKHPAGMAMTWRYEWDWLDMARNRTKD